MKPHVAVLFAAMVGAVGCSRNQPPQTAHAPATVPRQTALATTAEPTNPPLAPGAASIPTDPKIAPPQAAAPPEPADESPVTRSSHLASPRPESLPPVATDPSLDDPQTSADEESVREIRTLLAADKSLSATARQITIIARSGRVRLTGQVNTAAERAAVERAARKAANVIDVKNQLVVLE